MLIYDISDREDPVQVGLYANVGDSIVSWGIDVNDQYICLALVDNSLAQTPYISDYGGIIILEWQTILDAQELKQIAIPAFPNPTSRTSAIHFPEAADRVITILDYLGRKVLSTRSGLKTVELDVSEFPNGVYFIQVSGEYNSVMKLVKN